MPRDNYTTSSRSSGNTGGAANGSRGHPTDSPALRDYLSRSARGDPWTTYTARHAYEAPNNPPNNSYNTRGNGGYNYPPANPQNNNSYGNTQRDNTYNHSYNDRTVDRQNNNTANGSYGTPLNPPRNGSGYTNGESSNTRYRNTYDGTSSGRSINYENNQNNTSNRSQNYYTGSHR